MGAVRLWRGGTGIGGSGADEKGRRTARAPAGRRVNDPLRIVKCGDPQRHRVRGHQQKATRPCTGWVAGPEGRPYIPLMANNSANPYTLEIEACERPAGHFTWAIRRNGKLFQRADRVQTTEEAAERSGLAALEKLLSGRER